MKKTIILIVVCVLTISLYSQDIDTPGDIPVTISDIYDDDNYKVNELDELHKRRPREVFRHLGKLGLSRDDIRLIKGVNSSYIDLIIRKKKEINSVLLTNYFWRGDGKKIPEYGLRSIRYNRINGDEKRLFKDRLLGKKQGLYFLMSSTPVDNPYFGSSFRIRIPMYVVYGYRKANKVYGIIKIRDGLKINIRTFSRKHADYRGSYQDNPILLLLRRKPITIEDHPTITKIKEVSSGKYIGVQVKFYSKRQFFKSFLVKEENEKNYKEIGFSSYGSKAHKQAVLVEAVYEGERGRYLKANIYFKRKKTAKSYYIIAIDKSGAHTKGEHIEVVIPRVPYKDGKVVDETSNKEDKEKQDNWYKEFD